MSFEHYSAEDASDVNASEQEQSEATASGAFEHETFSFGTDPKSIETAERAVRELLVKFNWSVNQSENFAKAVGKQISMADDAKSVGVEISVGEDEITVTMTGGDHLKAPLIEKTESSMPDQEELRPGADSDVIDACDEVRLEGDKIVMVKRRLVSGDDDEVGWEKLK